MSDKLFSQRNQTPPTTFVYDHIPGELVHQVIHILRDCIGSYRPHGHAVASNREWIWLYDRLEREWGMLGIMGPRNHPEQQLVTYIDYRSIDKTLDFIDAAFYCIDTHVRHWSAFARKLVHPKITPDEAIAQLNQRFREHGVGYQFVKGQLVRMDSELIYDEVIEPSIRLLDQEGFEGALNEFMTAHDKLRKRDDGYSQDTIVWSLKALESTMVTICDRRGWSYKQGAQAKDLIEACFRHNLIPASLQSQFNALRATLESGVPVVRNKQGAHGQGQTVRTVPDYMAAYALNLTAANILLLVHLYEDK